MAQRGPAPVTAAFQESLRGAGVCTVLPSRGRPSSSLADFTVAVTWQEGCEGAARESAPPGEPVYKYRNSQGSVPSRDGGRIRQRLMGTIVHHSRYPHSKARTSTCSAALMYIRAALAASHACAAGPRGPGIMSLGLTDLAGPIGKES